MGLLLSHQEVNEKVWIGWGFAVWIDFNPPYMMWLAFWGGVAIWDSHMLEPKGKPRPPCQAANHTTSHNQNP